MLAILDMSRHYPFDDCERPVTPDTRHRIDDGTGDLLEVTFTDEGWVASRHIANPVGSESDMLYWVPTKDSPAWMLSRCGASRLPQIDDDYIDLGELVGRALYPLAEQQGVPIQSSLRIGMRPVEAEFRPSNRDRGNNLTDGIWEDVNGSSGSSMRPTGGTFVAQLRANGGLVTFVKVIVNSDYDDQALEKCLLALSG